MLRKNNTSRIFIYKLFIIILLQLFYYSNLYSQSSSNFLKIRSILVNSCDNGSDEGFQEMATFEVGSTDLNLDNISIKWATPDDLNPWQGFTFNSAKTIGLNATITNGCGLLIEPTDKILRANKKVLICTSYLVDPARNSFANLKDTTYVLYQNNPTVVTGHFRNLGGIRTFYIY